MPSLTPNIWKPNTGKGIEDNVMSFLASAWQRHLLDITSRRGLVINPCILVLWNCILHQIKDRKIEGIMVILLNLFVLFSFFFFLITILFSIFIWIWRKNFKAKVWQVLEISLHMSANHLFKLYGSNMWEYNCWKFLSMKYK